MVLGTHKTQDLALNFSSTTYLLNELGAFLPLSASHFFAQTGTLAAESSLGLNEFSEPGVVPSTYTAEAGEGFWVRVIPPVSLSQRLVC